MAELKTYRDVIGLWRTRAACARALTSVSGRTIKEGMIRTWWSRDAIPERWFRDLAQAAADCGFEGVNYARLNTMEAGAAIQVEVV